MIRMSKVNEFKDMKTSTRAFSRGCAAALALTTSGIGTAAPAMVGPSSWVATWQASPQPVWGPDFLFPTNVPPVLAGQTVRQVARISLGGSRLRLVLSNAYGMQPLIVGGASIAQPSGGGDIGGEVSGVINGGSRNESSGESRGTVVAATMRRVTFNGQREATIAPGASLISDPVTLSAIALSQVTVSVYLPVATPVRTFHWDGRQTSWIVPGDQSSAPVLTGEKGGVIETTTTRLLLSGIQVEASPSTPVVVVLGDSITDGAAATLNEDHRWPDFLAARLAPHGVAVVNAGISGARLLSDGMGVNALARLDRDVLTQPGVRSLIVMLGINDIAWPGTAFARDARRPTLAALEAAYRQLVAQAHDHGVRVMGATLTPFEDALPGTPLDNYYASDKDALRRQVNDWIRHSGVFDGVIDLDALLRDPAHPTRLAARYDSGDHLHPGDAGNRAMADAIDLRDLLPALETVGETTPASGMRERDARPAIQR